MKRSVLVAAMIAACGAASAAETSSGASEPKPMSSKAVSAAAPVERIIRQGRTCYKETIVEKMIESCMEGKIYYTPITEKSRVKVKCPAK